VPGQSTNFHENRSIDSIQGHIQSHNEVV
jgi:hypothetical protein